MVSARFVLVITFWSYQCLPDFLMSCLLSIAILVDTVQVHNSFTSVPPKSQWKLWAYSTCLLPNCVLNYNNKLWSAPSGWETLRTLPSSPTQIYNYAGLYHSDIYVSKFIKCKLFHFILNFLMQPINIICWHLRLGVKEFSKFKLYLTCVGSPVIRSRVVFIQTGRWSMR